MNAEKRRSEIEKKLKSAAQPISAGRLAGEFSVSRQVIVGDIAILRASGLEVNATPRGYVLSKPKAGLVKTIACIHDGKGMEEELNAIVDNGCEVIDVVVEHSVYGQMVGQLALSSRYDVSEFIRKVNAAGASPLSSLTGGVHLHNIRCPDEAAFNRVVEVLKNMGMLFSSDT